MKTCIVNMMDFLLAVKNENFQIKKCYNFLIVDLKHRLWVQIYQSADAA